MNIPKMIQTKMLKDLMEKLGTIMYRCYTRGYDCAKKDEPFLNEQEFKEKFEKIFKEKLFK